MPHLTLVTATDIARWADTRMAQERLPQLIRRLVHATTTTATRVGFPSGEGVQGGGWDGVVAIDEDHAFVPRGASVWELGTGADARAKANADYRKRTREGGGAMPVDPANTTFVFVTARRWSEKDHWAAEKRGQGVWKDVRAFDADDLDSWLELAYATHLWLSSLLGKKPRGADDPGTVWRDWSEMTRPALSPQLIIAGREKQLSEVQAWVLGRNAAPTFGLAAESHEESLAFATAAIELLTPDQRVATAARTVVVRDRESFAELTTSAEQLLLIPTVPLGELVSRAVRAGHRVLLPQAFSDSDEGSCHLPRVYRDAAEKALTDMGLTRDRARELSGLARRSILSLRRRLSPNAGMQQPPWAVPAVGPSLIPMLLIGEFNPLLEGDREAVARASGQSAQEFLNLLLRLASEPDPPVRRVGDVWYLVSKEDGWESLKRYLTRDNLDRFAGVAVDVLAVQDPRYDLPPDQQWATGIVGAQPRYSEFLRKGVADTLAMLGSRGKNTSISGGLTADGMAFRIVEDIFGRAQSDWKAFASLASYFPALGEAAPDAFLSAIDVGLEGESPAVLGLFNSDDAMFAVHPHTGLLWALETLAWSSEFAAPAALLLARLARVAPEVKIVNSPINSLQGILRTWYPQTGIGLDARLEVIDMLREKEPDVSWELMNKLLPEFGGHATLTPRPRWREWLPENPGTVTAREASGQTRGIVIRMLADAGTSGERWAVMVRALGKVQDPEHQAIVEALDALAISQIDQRDREIIWNALRELLSQHRYFPNAQWALPPDYLGRIEDVFHNFEPNNSVARYSWLFSHRPGLPEGREQDHRKHDEILNARRLEAARVLWEELGVTGIASVAGGVDRPDALGYLLGENGLVESPTDEENLLVSALAASDPKHVTFGRAFVGGLIATRGDDWLFAEIHGTGASWASEVRAEMLMVLPPDPRIQEEINRLDEAGQAHYWRGLNTFRVDPLHVEWVAEKLLTHSRPHAATELVAMSLKRDPPPSPTFCVEVLMAAVRTPADSTGLRADTYNIVELLDFLLAAVDQDQIEAEPVARLEYLYLPLLGRFEREPKLLDRQLCADPELFIEAVKHAYPEEAQRREDRSEAEEVSELLSRELLSSWCGVPGMQESEVDTDALIAWVTRARTELKAANREAVGDILLGQVLSRVPNGNDGAWPHPAVRELIESLRSERIERGISTGMFNRRGVVSRDPLAGGDLERGIEKRYETDAAKVGAESPRSAAMLRRMASGYRRDAEREDVDATLLHDLES